MDYRKITPLLVEAVKALKVEHENEINELRAKNEALKQRLEVLEGIVLTAGN
jgi:hypothetical protein